VVERSLGAERNRVEEHRDSETAVVVFADKILRRVVVDSPGTVGTIVPVVVVPVVVAPVVGVLVGGLDAAGILGFVVDSRVNFGRVQGIAVRCSLRSVLR
jgi:hypothetical protein